LSTTAAAQDPSARPIVRIEASSGWAPLELRELWEYRELTWFLTWRDVKVRYAQTWLGIAWAVIQPVATLVIFTIVFGRLAQVPSDGVPYPVFAFVALLPWQLFSTALTTSSNSIVGSSHLVSKVYFPRLIVPIASVTATLVDFVVVLVIAFVLMAAYRIWPGPGVVLLPLFVLFALATALGVGLWASALNVRYRDVRYVMPFISQFWLLASPVAYSTSMITSPFWRGVLYTLNPMVGVIDGFRWALLGTAPPSILMLPSMLMTAALLIGGVYFFKRTEGNFADVI
jgi:lipopolysaccharide transport system permease protein